MAQDTLEFINSLFFDAFGGQSPRDQVEQAYTDLLGYNLETMNNAEARINYWVQQFESGNTSAETFAADFLSAASSDAGTHVSAEDFAGNQAAVDAHTAFLADNPEASLADFASVAADSRDAAPPVDGGGPTSGALFTLKEAVVESDPEDPIEIEPTTETVTYWGFNPHEVGLEGVDNTAGGNESNLANEGPEAGGVPLSEMWDFVDEFLDHQLETLGLLELEPLLDAIARITEEGVADELQGGSDGDITVTVNDEGEVSIEQVEGKKGDYTGDYQVLLDIASADTAKAQVQLSQQQFEFINGLLFDAEGNSRLFEKEVTVFPDVPLASDGTPVLNQDDFDGAYLRDDDGEMVTQPLREVPGAEGDTMYTPIVLTTRENNGGTREEGNTTGDDDLIVAGRLGLLHQAQIDGGNGFNTLEVDAKGFFAQPEKLLNIQHVSVQNMPNIYSYGDGTPSDEGEFTFGREPGNFPNIADGEDEVISPNSILDLSRATEIEQLTVTEAGFEGLNQTLTNSDEPGSLTLAGIRNGADLNLQGGFSQDLNLHYGRGNIGDGIDIELHNVDFSDNDFNIAHNANTFNITSSGGDNRLLSIDALNDGTLSTINVDGEAHLQIEDVAGIYNNVNERLATFDASENTGGVNIGFVNGGQDRIDFTGSQADDVLTVNTSNETTVRNDVGANRYTVQANDVIAITDGTGGNLYGLMIGDAGVVNVAAEGEGSNSLSLEVAEMGEVDEVNIDFAGDDNSAAIDGNVDTANVTMSGDDNSAVIDGNVDTVFNATIGGNNGLVGVEGDVEELNAAIGGNDGTVAVEGDVEDLTANIDGDDGTVAVEGDVDTLTATIGGANGTVSVDGDVDTLTADLGGDNGSVIVDGEAGTVTANLDGENGMIFVDEADSVEVNATGGGNTVDLSGEDLSVEAGGSDNNVLLNGTYGGPDDPTGIDNGALLDINFTGEGSNGVTLGHPSGDERTNGDNGVTALEGSSIVGTDVALTVLEESNLTQANLSGITSVLMNADATLTVEQFLEIGPQAFSAYREAFGQEQTLNLIVNEDIDISGEDLSSLRNFANDDINSFTEAGIELTFTIAKGAELTIAAQQVHENVADDGIQVEDSEVSDELLGSVKVVDAGPEFDAFDPSAGREGYSNGGSLSSDFDGSVNAHIDQSITGFERPGTDATTQVLSIDSDADLEEGVIATDLTTNAQTLEFVGESDVAFEEGTVVHMTTGAEDGFVIDFSELGGNLDGMTLAGIGTNGGTGMEEREIQAIRGNNSDTRIDLELVGDVGTEDEPLTSSGVETYVATDLDGDDRTIWTSEPTQDVETLGLRGNFGHTLTYGNVERDIDFLMEVDLDKFDGYSVGTLRGELARDGAEVTVNVTNVAGELPEGETQRVQGIELENASAATINIEGGNTRIDDIDGDGDLESLTITGDGDVEIPVDSELAGSLNALDVTGVAGEARLMIADEAVDLSEVELSGVDQVVFTGDDSDLDLTAAQIAVIGVTNFVQADGVTDATLDAGLADLLEAGVDFTESAEFMDLIGASILVEDRLFAQTDGDTLTIASVGGESNTLTVTDNEVVDVNDDTVANLSNIDNLQIIGNQDLAVSGSVTLDDGGFTVDFGDLEGTLSGLTVDDFQNVDAVVGNGAEGTRIDVGLDGDVGSQGDGLVTDGVGTYVVTDLNEGDHQFWTSNPTNDVEFLGLQGNAGHEITFGDVIFGTQYLLEGDGFANADDSLGADKNLNPNVSEIGAVVDRVVPGLEGEGQRTFNINNQGVELGETTSGGERPIHADGIESNAGEVAIDIADGNAVLGNLTADEASSVTVSASSNATIWMDNVDDNLDSFDASGVAGQALLGFGAFDGNEGFGPEDFDGSGLTIDISGVELTGLDGIVLANELGLTINIEQFTNETFIDASGDDDAAELTIDGLSDELFSVGALDGDISVAKIILADDDEVTLNPDTDLTGVPELEIPEGTTAHITAEQLHQLALGEGTISGEGRINVTDFDQDTVDTMAAAVQEAIDEPDVEYGLTIGSDVIQGNIDVIDDVTLPLDLIESPDNPGDSLLPEAGDFTFLLGNDQTLTVDNFDVADGLNVRGDDGAADTPLVRFNFSSDNDPATTFTDGIDVENFSDVDLSIRDALINNFNSQAIEDLLENFQNSGETGGILNIRRDPDADDDIRIRDVVVEPDAVPEGLTFSNGGMDVLREVTIDLQADGDNAAEIDGNVELNDGVQVANIALLTINSVDVSGADPVTAEATKITGNIAEVGGDDDLLDVVINAAVALDIEGTLTFRNEDGNGIGTLTVTGEAPVSIKGVVAGNDVEQVDINSDTTLTITGGSPAFDADGSAETLNLSGEGDMAFGTEEGELGVDGDDVLTALNAAELEGDLALGEVSNINEESFTFTSGTGVTTLELTDSTLDGDTDPDEAGSWTFDYGNAAVDSGLTIGDNSWGQNGSLQILGDNVTVTITDDTDWTPLDTLEIPGNSAATPIVLEGGTELTLTAEQADGLHIVDGDGDDDNKVTIRDLDGAQGYDFSNIETAVADVAHLVDDEEYVQLDGDTDLGDFAIQLSNDPGLGEQVIGFATNEQADGRVVDAGGQNNGGVAWLFDEVLSKPLDAGGYDSDLVRLFMTDALVNNDSDIESLFENLSTDIEIINIQFTGDLEEAVTAQGFARTLEVQAFVDLADGAELIDPDDIRFVEELDFELGGDTNIDSILIDNILGTEVEEGDDNFQTLTISSRIFDTDEEHSFSNPLAPREWDPDEDLAEPAGPNTIGDIASGGNQQLLAVVLTTQAARAGEDEAPLTIGSITFDRNDVITNDASLEVNGSADEPITIGALDLTDASLTNEDDDEIVFDLSGDGHLVVTDEITIDASEPGTEAIINTSLDNDATVKAINLGTNISNLTINNNGAGDLIQTGGSPALTGENLESISININGTGDVAIGSRGIDDDENPFEDGDDFAWGADTGQVTELTFAGGGGGAGAGKAVFQDLDGEEFTYTESRADQDSDVALIGGTLEGGGTWTFNGQNNGDNEVSITEDVDLSNGGTISFNNVDLFTEGEVDFMSLDVVLATGSDATVRAGSVFTVDADILNEFDSVETADEDEDAGLDEGKVRQIDDTITARDGIDHYILNPERVGDDITFDNGNFEPNLTRETTSNTVTVVISQAAPSFDAEWTGFLATDVLSVQANTDISQVNDGDDLGGIGTIEGPETGAAEVAMTVDQHDGLATAVDAEDLTIILRDVALAADDVNGLDGVGTYRLDDDMANNLGNTFTLAATAQTVELGNQGDTIFANTGGDTIVLGNGDDTIVYTDADQGLTFDNFWIGDIVDDSEALGSSTQAQITEVTLLADGDNAVDFGDQGDWTWELELAGSGALLGSETVTVNIDPGGTGRTQLLVDLQQEIEALANYDAEVATGDGILEIISEEAGDGNDFEVNATIQDGGGVDQDVDGFIEDADASGDDVGEVTQEASDGDPGVIVLGITDEEADRVTNTALEVDGALVTDSVSGTGGGAGLATRLEALAEFDSVSYDEDEEELTVESGLDGGGDGEPITIADEITQIGGELTVNNDDDAPFYTDGAAGLAFDRIQNWGDGDNVIDFSALGLADGDFQGEVGTGGDVIDDVDEGQFGWFEEGVHTFVLANLDDADNITEGDLLIQLDGTGHGLTTDDFALA